MLLQELSIYTHTAVSYFPATPSSIGFGNSVMEQSSDVSPSQKRDQVPLINLGLVSTWKG